MADTKSKTYFERRAEEERLAAERAVDARAAQSHRELSDHYRQMASTSEQERPDREAEPDGTLAREFRIVP